MKLLYATSIVFPSPLANRIQIISTAQAFYKRLGLDFVLGVGESNSNEFFDCPHFDMGKDIPSYKLALKYIFYACKNKVTHVFCREDRLMFFLILYSKILFWRPNINFIFEVHDLNHRRRFWYRFILKNVQRIVVISSGLKKILIDIGIDSNNVIVSPDAVDLDRFDINISTLEARSKLSIPQEKKIIIYTGSLEKWKGVDTLYKASNYFDDSFLFLIIGGRSTWVKEFEEWYPKKNNFVMLGYKDHNEIPLYLKSADVLVIPNSAKLEISNIATSPMKLFEYMSSGRPIVASNIPSICEIIDTNSAELVNPDDELSLAEGIRKVIDNKSLSKLKSMNALGIVKKYTWDNRVKVILENII